jgi:hypothetical protein
MLYGSLLQWFNGMARLLQRMSGQKVLRTKIAFYFIALAVETFRTCGRQRDDLPWY